VNLGGIDAVTLVSSGHTDAPGCLTVTAIDPAGSEDVAELDQRARQIMSALAEEPGHLGTVFATTPDGRHFVVTAWASVAAVESLRRTPHTDATRAFFSGSLGTRVMTSVWVPHHLNPIWTRDEDDQRPERSDPGSQTWL